MKKKISFSSSLCFLFIFIFFRVWVLCFRTINEKKNCTGSGICIISLWISIYAAAASTTTAARPLPHHTHSIRNFFCHVSLRAIYEEQAKLEKWNRKLKLTSFILFEGSFHSSCERVIMHLLQCHLKVIIFLRTFDLIF